MMMLLPGISMMTLLSLRSMYLDLPHHLGVCSLKCWILNQAASRTTRVSLLPAVRNACLTSDISPCRVHTLRPSKARSQVFRSPPPLKRLLNILPWKLTWELSAFNRFGIPAERPGKEVCSLKQFTVINKSQTLLKRL